MGMGDEIMATAQARAVYDTTGMQVYFADPVQPTPEWTKIFKDNPCITKTGKGFPVANRTGLRPYILGQTDKQVVFNPNFHAVPGELYLTNNEIKEARKAIGKNRDFILVQPETKKIFSKGNKAWPSKHWNTLVDSLLDKGYTVLQMLKNRSEDNLCLKRTKPIIAETFRTAAAVIQESKLLISTEGGLHHAAAALKKPAVVIFTGFSHPQTLGYSTHLNLRYDNSPPCGMKIECDHCKRMAEKLSPDLMLSTGKTVTEEILDYIDQLPTNIHKG